MKQPKLFPKGFIWGAGTSAFQIEGAAELDGKSRSIWDEFTEREGTVQGSENAKVACDHYHRSLEDLSLMREMQLKAYRFSISWPRVLPDGIGRVNQRGLEFYDRLVDRLLEAGIDPWVTLYHWDLPISLMKNKGWLSEDSPSWFEELTTTIYQKLGDRVQHWITLNEPNIFVPFGYQRGLHAPGLKLSDKEIVLITHNLLKAHFLAAKTLRSEGRARVGCALSMSPWEPDATSADESKAKELAETKTFEMSSSNPFKSLVLWSEALINGAYPAAYRNRFEEHFPQNSAEEINRLKGSVDFCALNIYASSGALAVDSEDKVSERKYAQCERTPKTLFHWPVTPGALYWGPYWMHQKYGLPIVITENGMSAHDWVHLDGIVHDSHRIDFTRKYLLELHRAIVDGVPVQGYFHWSFIDNFEWAEGYRQKFGLVHVDRKTQSRTIKDSGTWFGMLAGSNCIPMD